MAKNRVSSQANLKVNDSVELLSYVKFSLKNNFL